MLTRVNPIETVITFGFEIPFCKMRARLDDKNCQCQTADILCGYSVFFTLHSLFLGGGRVGGGKRGKRKAGMLPGGRVPKITFVRKIFMKDPISETSNDLPYSVLYNIFYKHS